MSSTPPPATTSEANQGLQTKVPSKTLFQLCHQDKHLAEAGEADAAREPAETMWATKAKRMARTGHQPASHPPPDSSISSKALRVSCSALTAQQIPTLVHPPSPPVPATTRQQRQETPENAVKG